MSIELRPLVGCECTGCTEARRSLDPTGSHTYSVPQYNVSPAMYVATPSAEAVAEARRVAVEAQRAVDEAQRAAFLATFEANAVIVIPDDELVDKGDYLLWVGFTGLGRPIRAQEATAFSTIDAFISYYGVMRGHYTAMRQGLRSHPSNKPILVEGAFRYDIPDGPEYRLFRPAHSRDGRTFQETLVHRQSRSVDNYSRFPDMDASAPVTRVPWSKLSTEIRRWAAENLIHRVYNRGAIGLGRRDRALTALAEAQPRRSSSPWITYRGDSVYGAAGVLARRNNLRVIGAIIAKPDDHTGSDLVEELERTPIGNKSRLIEAWNDRCNSDEEVTVAACGHVCCECDTYETIDGDVCHECFHDDYVEVEDATGYRHRDNLYRHSDDCWYTYREDDYDEDEDESEDSVGGLVKGYSTNVLDYLECSTMRPSKFGDFLMGVELEVVPKRGYRSETVRHTQENLCDGYAIMKNDGSLDGGGFEIVTAPRTLAQHVAAFKPWEPHEKLRAWDAGCCGLHVHISSSAFSQATLGKFIEFINATENDDLILSIAGRTPTRDEQAQQYCAREGFIPVANPKQMVSNKSESRYHMVNTTNMGRSELNRLGLATHERGKDINTVELRIFRASLKKGRLLAQVEFAHAAVMFCRATSMRGLRREHFIKWLQKAAPLYPHLAKWFGVRANTKTVTAAPEVVAAEEV